METLPRPPDLGQSPGNCTHSGRALSESDLVDLVNIVAYSLLGGKWINYLASVH